MMSKNLFLFFKKSFLIMGFPPSNENIFDDLGFILDIGPWPFYTGEVLKKLNIPFSYNIF